MGQIPVFINTISKRPRPFIYVSPLAALAYNGKRSTWFWQTATAFKDSNINYLALCRKKISDPWCGAGVLKLQHASEPPLRAVRAAVNLTICTSSWLARGADAAGTRTPHGEPRSKRNSPNLSFHSSNRMHTYHQICFVAADRQLRHLFLLVLWPNFQISLVRLLPV